MAAIIDTESAVTATKVGRFARRRRSASGFTLVELLMVILIISMLMGMLSVAIWKAFEYVNKAAAVVDIEQIHNALNAYKESVGQYPPSLSDTTLTERKARFMRHLNVAFSNSNYGVTAASFDTLRNGIRTAGSLGTNSQPYYFRDAGGGAQLLDLNTLDQAEALVFWLAGFPTPCNSGTGVPVAPSRTYGFNRDRDNPMRRDAAAAEATDPKRFRTDARMEFKEERFADNDNDGWLEILPQRAIEGTLTAPIVYFDSPTYVASTTAPGASSFDIRNQLGYPRYQDAMAPSLAANWGVAFPMAEQFDPAGRIPMRWRNPQSFQLISPGKDGRYSYGEAGDLLAAVRVVVYPTGESYSKSDGFQKRGSYAIEELDNLNNLGTVTLDEARQQAR